VRSWFKKGNLIEFDEIHKNLQKSLKDIEANLKTCKNLAVYIRTNAYQLIPLSESSNLVALSL
jgi:hypothetical protein